MGLVQVAVAREARGRRQKSKSGPGESLSPRIVRVLTHLAQARMFAEDLGRNIWDFAVEMPTLGLSNSELRWLVCKKYVEHARETTRSTRRRSFAPSATLYLTPKSCFVITDAGRALLRTLAVDAGGMAASLPTDTPLESIPAWPRWDATCRELRLGIKLVKQFRLPSPNQEMILSAFEEEGWPTVIDDPLPPQSEQDAKRRLHDTIKSLNRHQVNRLIRFKGNGTGQGILWEIVANRNGRAVG